MPANTTIQLVRPGFWHTRRCSMRVFQGIVYFFLENERPHALYESGDAPLTRTLRMVPMGLQTPRFAPTLAEGTEGTTGTNILDPGVYYVRFRWYSSALEKMSNPGGWATVTVGAPNDSIAVSASAFVDTADNLFVTDHADFIIIERTAVNPDIVDGEDEAGLYYECARISKDSFVVHPDWVTATAYVAGDKIKTTVSGIVVRYLALADHTSAAAFATDIGATPPKWLALGGSPVILTENDSIVAIDANILDVRRGVPVSGFAGIIFKGTLFIAGMTDYSLSVSVTNGSNVVNIASGNHPYMDRFPMGVLNTKFQVYGHARPFTVNHWLSQSQVLLDENYDGPTNADATARISMPPGVWFCESAGQGQLGTTLPDAMPFGNYMELPVTDGSQIQAMYEGAEVAYIFTDTTVLNFSQIGGPIRMVENRSVRTQSDRGICSGLRGEVFFITSTGINMLTGVGQEGSTCISDQVRDAWTPNATTRFAWEVSAISKSVLFYDYDLHKLWMIGPRKGNTNNNLALCWDQDTNLFYWDEPWKHLTTTPLHPAGTWVEVDITVAFRVKSQNKSLMMVMGRMAMDGDDDEMLETDHQARMWQWNDGKVDEVPQDKITTARHHHIPYRRSMRPLQSEAGELVMIQGAHIEIEPLDRGTTFQVWRRSTNDNGVVVDETERIDCSLQKSGQTVRPRLRWGRTQALVLSGVQGTENDKLVVRKVVEEVRVSEKGGR